jgi:hypothetical protein
MLRAVNWGEKLGHIFGGHHGRILRIMILFLCALGVLVGIYRARSDRIQKEISVSNKHQLKSVGHVLPAASTTKWVVVGNPDTEDEFNTGQGSNYVCSVARVSREAGWKVIIIGEKLSCCRMPDCYPIQKSQFLRMSYRTASVLKTLMETGQNPQAYKEAIRNLAFIWAIHRGARYVFDAYVEEYQSAGVSIPKFEEELNRQLHTLALDESLALVEERSRSRTSLFRNPYSHFGRPDVRLLPSGPGTGSGSNSHTLHHATYHQYSTFNLGHAHGHGHHNHNAGTTTNHKTQDFPTFRICEVRPPSIEKFLEIDKGWWDMRAPALVLPGDTMPPLCTRNTLFSPEVFWALPLLPDYSAGEGDDHPEVPQNASRIPPWYIRGLWSQSLLGDLGGSIRLTLSRVPTLQLNQDYFVGGDYEPNLNPSSHANANNNRTGSSKLLKRWHCRSRSTFRCLSLMSKELSKSVYLKKNDLSLIDAWIIDLKSIHYAEPPMLPRRRSHTNPCLGADGLHGVSFYPSLEPNEDFLLEDYVAKRNDTLKSIVAKIESMESKALRDKRETERPIDLPLWQLPPNENSTYAPIDWSAHVPQLDSPKEDISVEQPPVNNAEDSYYLQYKESQAQKTAAENQGAESQPEDFVYHHHDMLSNPSSYSRRTLPLVDKSVYPTDSRSSYSSATRSAKQFKAFLQEIAAKSADASADEFPILKAISENMCPGFGPLIPYQPRNVYKDALLIVVFTNQHYDLIPTLEVLYRSAFPNILYCGHPHESVEIFLRKYQSVEHRSFSFLPTYTRATYECVLGAMEMNYEVKGYMVVTDETLMKTWNIEKLDMNKIWVSSSGHDVPVTKSSWPKLDPRGQKLPRLLDGIIATWKLFSYILVGQDSWTLEPRGIKKRSIDEDVMVPIASEISPVVSGPAGIRLNTEETLDTGETAYIPRTIFSWSDNPNSNKPKNETSNPTGIDSGEDVKIPTQSEDKNADLSVSDWDYVKGSSFVISKGKLLDDLSPDNETESGSEDSVDEEVLVGEDSEDDEVAADIIEHIPALGPSSPSPNDQTTDENDSLILATPTDESILENSTALWPAQDSLGSSSNNNGSSSDSSESSSTTGSESSVGVPLYHVEHIEPPTAPTWHKPENGLGSSSTERVDNKGKDSSAENPSMSSGSFSFSASDIPANSKEDNNKEKTVSGSLSSTHAPATEKQSDQENGSSTSASPESSSSSSSTTDSNSNTLTMTHVDEYEQILKKEIDSLLDGLNNAYLNMLSVVAQYQESNDTSRNTEYSSEGGDTSLLEDAKSHRISPREFRHIRCTLQDDGHQSELCSTLRLYINLLGTNLGRDIRLFHDTVPMYYLPSWTTKSFYSVANVLLHYGVMDELALPILFRGLADESDWTNLNRNSDLLAQTPSPVPSGDSSKETLVSEGHYLHPFNLHKVYSDPIVRHEFCSRYLLRVLQM